jgi:hypothetical protein
MTLKIENLRDEEWISGLEDFCKKLVSKDDIVVELGSFSGESTSIFAQYAKQVYAVDPWSQDYGQEVMLGCGNPAVISYINSIELQDMSLVEQLFDERMSKFSNVVKLKMTDTDALAKFKDFSVNIVYIDAIHTKEQVSSAIMQWSSKIRRKGYIAGHDYSIKDWPGVVASVDCHFGRPQLLFSDTSWAVRL